MGQRSVAGFVGVREHPAYLTIIRILPFAVTQTLSFKTDLVRKIQEQRSARIDRCVRLDDARRTCREQVSGINIPVVGRPIDADGVPQQLAATGFDTAVG